ncbi:MAG: FAD-dependent monooxygenase [Hyphomicrobiaceae bacterium]|nr:FAD-dependent monooxygenase [Hyphomicrobiaceae bacterium]
MATTADSVYDVVVVGGSYAGLAVALGLARTLGGSLELAVVERRPMAPASAAGEPRAFAVSAGSRKLLDALGVWAELDGLAQPVARIEITDSALEDSVRPVLLTYDNVVAGEAQTHIVEATHLQRALVAAVLAEPSITIVAPATLDGLDQTPGSARLHLTDGRIIAGRLAIAADGARSRLREAAGNATSNWRYGQTGIVTTVELEEDHGSTAVQHFLPAGPFALLPLPGRRACITWSEEEARAAEILALGDDAFLAEAQQRAGWRLGALSLAGPRAGWPLEARVTHSMTGRRLALVGDAARSVHPVAGQGVNLGFRDVAALVEVLADGLRLGLEPGDATVLERYQRWRRFDGTQSALAFTTLNALFSRDWTLLRGIRGAGLGIVDRLPGLKQLLVAEAAGSTGEVPRLLEGALP